MAKNTTDLGTTNTTEGFPRTSDGRRKLKISKAELYRLEKARRLERFVEMKLSRAPRYTNPEIADELGVSVATLKRWSKSEEFEKLYHQVLDAEGLSRSTRLQFNRLVPTAIEHIQSLAFSSETPASVRLKALEYIVTMGGGREEKTARDDLEETRAFLRELQAARQIPATTVNIAVLPGGREGEVKILPSPD